MYAIGRDLTSFAAGSCCGAKPRPAPCHVFETIPIDLIDQKVAAVRRVARRVCRTAHLRANRFERVGSRGSDRCTAFSVVGVEAPGCIDRVDIDRFQFRGYVRRVRRAGRDRAHSTLTRGRGNSGQRDRAFGFRQICVGFDRGGFAFGPLVDLPAFIVSDVGGRGLQIRSALISVASWIGGAREERQRKGGKWPPKTSWSRLRDHSHSIVPGGFDV